MRADLFWASAIWLGALFLLTNAQRISKGDQDKITKGLELGKGLASALNDGNFPASLRNFGTRASAFLGAIGPLVAFAFSFIPGGGDNGLKVLYEYMKKEFDVINMKLDTLPLRFKEVESLIDWRSVQTNYGVYERNIRAAEDSLNQYFRVSKDGRTAAKEEFMTRYRNGVSGSVQKLYDGVVSHRQILSQNLIAAVVKRTGCYKKQVESFGLGLTQLVLQGVKVKMAYYAFKGWPTTDLEKEWAGKLKIFCGVLLQASAKCKTGYHKQMRRDVKKLIVDNSNQKPKELKWTIYRFLVAKYDWRYWMVVAYKDIRGYDKHTIDTCGGGFWLNQYGKNIIVASRSKTYHYFQRSRAQQVYNTITNQLHHDCSKYLRPYKYHWRTAARWVVNRVRQQVSHRCYPFALILAVTGDEHITWVSKSNRRFYSFLGPGSYDSNFNCSRIGILLRFHVLIFG